MKKICISLLCLFFCLSGCKPSGYKHNQRGGMPFGSKYNQLNGSTWVPATLEQGLGGLGGLLASLKFFDRRFKLNLPMVPGLVITGAYSLSGDKLAFVIDNAQDIAISGEFFDDGSLILGIDNEGEILKIEFVRER